MADASTHRYRSHTCGALRESDIGSETRLSGWVHRVRDHGGLLFVDLRDHYGLTQIVVDPDTTAFKTAERLRSEWVVRIDGKVRARPEGTLNAELATGAVEVYASAIEVLSEAKELPVPVFGEPEYPEDMRLTYRFLDLRRETLHGIIMKRLAITRAIRSRMHDAGFNEFPTPILTASSPEGARDFLVPSRVHAGKFYALPQAPQQYKQLLMMSGFDRYFQIAPCFRDEDPRADRLPGEFYQLDVEMSFVEQDDVLGTMEPIIRGVFEEFAEGKTITPSFPRIPYDTAIAKYGSDKPDLRNPIEMQDVTEHFRGSGFKVFAGMIEKDPKVRVWALPAKGGGSRAFCDRMNAWAQKEGQPGLGYVFWREATLAAERFSPNHPVNKLARIQHTHKRNKDEAAKISPKSPRMGLDLQTIEATFAHNWPEFDDASRDQHARETPETYFEPTGPIAKNIGEARTEALRQQLGLESGDAAFFVAGDPARFYKFAGLARDEIGRELNKLHPGFVDENRFAFCWIVDFPFYEWNEDGKQIDFSHNPFSMPQGGSATLDAAKSTEDYLAIKAYQYDLVCNGYELASGGIRNHRPDTMVKAFGVAGLGPEVVEARFGALYRAFQYGAPPHGGMAAGIERIVMLLTGCSTVRDVALFPMNQQASDLLMGAPSEASNKQLNELHIRLNLPQRKS